MGLSVLFVAMAVMVQSSVARLTPEEVASRQISRQPFGLVRDGFGAMRIDPLPFTAQRPAGTPDFDQWEGHGFVGQVAEPAGSSTPWVNYAVAAGICDAAQPCVFSFTYLMAVQNTYTATGNQVALRFIITREGVRYLEGLLWSPRDGVYEPHVREATVWRAVTDPGEDKRLRALLEACIRFHKTAVATAKGER